LQKYNKIIILNLEQLIFETERLYVRKFIKEDLNAFYEMHANSNVMKYVSEKIMTYEENEKDLNELIAFYDKQDNDFWIYAVVRNLDKKFIGTVALVKDKNNDDEIGYRFLEKYWGNGFGNEIVKGLIKYTKNIGFSKLIACVSPDNIASEKIIKNYGFKLMASYVCDDLKIPERKYKLIL